LRVRANANFLAEDQKRATMIERKSGEEFVMDEREEGESLYLLYQAGRLSIIDEKFIPKSAIYKILHQFSFVNEHGEKRIALPVSKEITLPQAIASKFMATRHILPANESQWRPTDLLGPVVKFGEPKVMFDEDPGKDNWIRKGRE